MRSSGKVVITSLRLHDVGHQDVLAVLDECRLIQRQVRIAAGLVKSLASCGRLSHRHDAGREGRAAMRAGSTSRGRCSSEDRAASHPRLVNQVLDTIN